MRRATVGVQETVEYWMCYEKRDCRRLSGTGGDAIGKLQPAGDRQGLDVHYERRVYNLDCQGLQVM